MLSSEQNPEECDTTGDHSSTTVGQIKITTPPNTAAVYIQPHSPGFLFFQIRLIACRRRCHAPTFCLRKQGGGGCRDGQQPDQ